VVIATVGWVADHGLLYVARRQAQNAADAGAYAGAVAFAYDNDVRAVDGPAKSAAYEVAIRNLVASEAPNVIDPTAGDFTDITFFSEDETQFPGQLAVDCAANDCIRVDVYRNQERANPLSTWFTQLVGVTEQGVRASAIARAAPAGWTDCLKPWLIPDKFNDVNGNGVFDVGVDSYTNPGWSEADIGTSLTLKEGNPSTSQPIAPGDFFRIEEADTYEEAITGCEIEQGIGDDVIIRPGNGVGPTKHGVEDLLAANDGEPVTVLVGMFDPAAFAALDRQSGTFPIEIVNMMGFKIYSYGPGNQVVGEIVAAPGEIMEGYEDTGGNLLKKVMLIR
jgi:hypothetical protein